MGQTIELVLVALGLATAAMFFFAAEGAFCLVLAFPLAAVVGMCGGVFGRAIALRGMEPPSRTGLAALFAPLLVLAEPRATAPLHEVRSVVEVAAPPAVVWRHVVAFPALPPATEGVFRVGGAAPLGAPGRGSGGRALTFRDFTTGSLVGAIT